MIIIPSPATSKMTSAPTTIAQAIALTTIPVQATTQIAIRTQIPMTLSTRPTIEIMTPPKTTPSALTAKILPTATPTKF